LGPTEFFPEGNNILIVLKDKKLPLSNAHPHQIVFAARNQCPSYSSTAMRLVYSKPIDIASATSMDTEDSADELFVIASHKA
jgi:hypothetical protein